MRRYPAVATLGPKSHADVVSDVFATAHPRYDLLNRLLSFRRDVGWRAFAAERMRLPPAGKLLDVATGTADLAIAAARRWPGARVTGIDTAETMLREGRRKVTRGGLSGRIELQRGDALAIPFPAGSFDAAAVAFGMRNFPDRPGALREMARVTAPGGRVLVLEMTFAPARAFRAPYGVYLRRILPFLARLLSPNPAAYAYLADSIMRFPGPEAFSEIMRRAGLAAVEHHALTFGAAYLHVGRVPAVRESSPPPNGTPEGT
jgi:demethylmenaquinone methyltransferase / 2-methoxy-6-polyprenyl-1,4-benzoquinol methylase